MKTYFIHLVTTAVVVLTCKIKSSLKLNLKCTILSLLILSLSLSYVLWACKSLSGNRKKNKRIHKQEDKERDNKRIYVPIADAGPQQMYSANPL